MYYLIDLERTEIFGKKYYWKSGARGYSVDIIEAGLYTFQEAKDRCNADIGNNTVMLPVTGGKY